MWIFRPWRLLTWPWRFYRKERSFGRRVYWRFVWVFIAACTGFGLTLSYREDILLWSYIPAGGRLSPFEGNLPIFTNPTGALYAVFKMSVLGAFAFVLPVGYIGLYTLVRPALTPTQRRWAEFAPLAATLLFVTGVAFVYYVLLPQGMRFLLSFAGNVATPFISLTFYMDLALGLMFWVAVIFQMPLLTFTLAKLNVIRYRRLNNKYFHKLVPLALVVFAVFITPGTDPITPVFVWVPLYLLWHVSLFTSWLAHPEHGNYLWLGSLGRVAGAPVRAVRRAYRKVRFW